MSKRLACTRENLDEISGAVGRGGVIVFPTDTVYGIGCDPYRGRSVDRIYGIKRRDRGKPLPVLAFSADDVGGIAGFGPESRRIAERFWPGKVTLVLRLEDGGLGRSLGITDKIAVRVPGGRCARMILERCRLLVGTSANPSGARPFADPRDCPPDMRGYDILVDGGAIGGGGGGGAMESTIVDASAGEIRVVREGAVRAQEILGAA